MNILRNFLDSLRSAEHASEIPSSIKLRMFRHDAKGKKPEDGNDRRTQLTTEGKQHATEVGSQKDFNQRTSAAITTTFDRAYETAMRQMDGGNRSNGGKEWFPEEMSVEEIQATVSQNAKIGRNYQQSTNLEFDWPSDSPATDKGLKWYENGIVMTFLLNDSDKLVEESNDPVFTSYTRCAANVAGIIKRYVKIMPRWSNINQKDPKKYEAENYEMQRYIASHQTVLESFLVKAVEKTKGRKAAVKLAEELGNGFGFSEGFEIDIIERNRKPAITLTYNGESIEISPKVLDGIIEDGVKLNAKINNKLAKSTKKQDPELAKQLREDAKDKKGARANYTKLTNK